MQEEGGGRGFQRGVAQHPAASIRVSKEGKVRGAFQRGVAYPPAASCLQSFCGPGLLGCNKSSKYWHCYPIVPHLGDVRIVGGEMGEGGVGRKRSILSSGERGKRGRKRRGGRGEGQEGIEGDVGEGSRRARVCERECQARREGNLEGVDIGGGGKEKGRVTMQGRARAGVYEGQIKGGARRERHLEGAVIRNLEALG